MRVTNRHPNFDPKTVLEIRQLVADEAGCKIDRVELSTRLAEDLGLDGDDFDFVDEIAERFAIDMSEYRWYEHHGLEGCNPLWLLMPPWWAQRGKVPVRVADLVSAVEEGRWMIEYLDEPLQPRRDRAGVLLVLIVLAVMTCAALM